MHYKDVQYVDHEIHYSNLKSYNLTTSMGIPPLKGALSSSFPALPVEPVKVSPDVLTYHTDHSYPKSSVAYPKKTDQHFYIGKCPSNQFVKHFGTMKETSPPVIEEVENILVDEIVMEKFQPPMKYFSVDLSVVPQGHATITNSSDKITIDSSFYFYYFQGSSIPKMTSKMGLIFQANETFTKTLKNIQSNVQNVVNLFKKDMNGRFYVNCENVKFYKSYYKNLNNINKSGTLTLEVNNIVTSTLSIMNKSGINKKMLCVGGGIYPLLKQNDMSTLKSNLTKIQMYMGSKGYVSNGTSRTVGHLTLTAPMGMTFSNEIVVNTQPISPALAIEFGLFSESNLYTQLAPIPTPNVMATISPDMGLGIFLPGLQSNPIFLQAVNLLETGKEALVQSEKIKNQKKKKQAVDAAKNLIQTAETLMSGIIPGNIKNLENTLRSMLPPSPTPSV